MHPPAPTRRERIALVAFAAIFVLALTGGVLAVAHRCPAQASSSTTRPAAVLATAESDPGQRLYAVLHIDGATMPPSWAALADASRPAICATPEATRYRQFPATYRDEFGVSPAEANAAIDASGFCA
jgi:hypothetical protein